MLRKIGSLILLIALLNAPLRANVFHWKANGPSEIAIEIDLLATQPQPLTDDLILNVTLSYPKEYEVKIEEIHTHLLVPFVLLDKPTLRIVQCKQIESREQENQTTAQWTYHIALDALGVVPLSLFSLHFTLPDHTKQIAIALPVFMLEVVELSLPTPKNAQEQNPFALSSLILWLMGVSLCIFLMVLLHQPFLRIRHTIYLKLMHRKKLWQLQALNKKYAAKANLDAIYFSLLKFITSEIEQHFPSFPTGSMAMPLLRSWLIASKDLSVATADLDTFIEQLEKIQFAKLAVSSAHCDSAFLLANDLLSIFYQRR